MPPENASADPGLRRLVVRNLVRLRKEQNAVSNAEVREAARLLGCSERTVWRDLRRGAPASAAHEHYTVDSFALSKLYEWRGNMAFAALQVADALGDDAPSARTIRRAMARDIPNVERAAMNTGIEGQRQLQLYRRFEVENRNELWEADHKELSLRVWYKGELVSPWATVFLDAMSRTASALLTPGRPTQEDVLAALFGAVTGAEDTPLCGIPLILRWDNDTTFTGDAVTEVVARLGAHADEVSDDEEFACRIEPADPYTPHQKGKVERFNRTIEQRFSSGQRGWMHGPAKRNGELYDEEEGFLEWDELLDRFSAFLRDYNYEWESRALSNRKPAEAWSSDETQLRECGKRDLLWVLPTESRTVGKSGIRFRNDDYFAPELANLVGQRVDIRTFPHDGRRVEVCCDGDWVCTAVPQSRVSDEDSDRFFRERGQTASRIHRRLQTGSVAQAPEGKRPDEQPADVRQVNAKLLSFLRPSDGATDEETAA